VFENKELRSIFGPKGTRERAWRKLHNEELCMYSWGWEIGEVHTSDW
jgi:hypothetical protein